LVINSHCTNSRPPMTAPGPSLLSRAGLKSCDVRCWSASCQKLQGRECSEVFLLQLGHSQHEGAQILKRIAKVPIQPPPPVRPSWSIPRRLIYGLFGGVHEPPNRVHLLPQRPPLAVARLPSSLRLTVPPICPRVRVVLHERFACKLRSWTALTFIERHQLHA
jgi:hypothetical protein